MIEMDKYRRIKCIRCQKSFITNDEKIIKQAKQKVWEKIYTFLNNEVDFNKWKELDKLKKEDLGKR